MFETFKEPAGEAIERAHEEAREMGHGTVGVEHLLLGLVSDQTSTAGRVLAEFGLTIAPLRELVRKHLDPGPGSTPKGLRLSPEAKDALRSVYRFGLNEPGTEHILLVLVRWGEGGACESLQARGADPDQIRFETKKQAWLSSFAGPSPRVEGHSVGYAGELDFGDWTSALTSAVSIGISLRPCSSGFRQTIAHRRPESRRACDAEATQHRRPH